jgi:hypothetical protein
MVIDATDAASRLSRLVKYGSGSLTSRDFTDLVAVLDELRELRGYRWEEWGIELDFGGGITNLEYFTERHARTYYKHFLQQSPRKARSISLVRRVCAQGNWIKVEAESDEQHSGLQAR